jgi:hypothetical protein
MMCSAELSSTRATQSRVSVVALWIREIFNHSRDRVTATHVGESCTLRSAPATTVVAEPQSPDMNAANWIALRTCSLDGDVIIECGAQRNPKDGAVTVRMQGERHGTDYVAGYVDEYHGETRDWAVEQFINASAATCTRGRHR